MRVHTTKGTLSLREDARARATSAQKHCDTTRREPSLEGLRPRMSVGRLLASGYIARLPGCDTSGVVSDEKNLPVTVAGPHRYRTGFRVPRSKSIVCRTPRATRRSYRSAVAPASASASSRLSSERRRSYTTCTSSEGACCCACSVSSAAISCAMRSCSGTLGGR